MPAWPLPFIEEATAKAEEAVEKTANQLVLGRIPVATKARQCRGRPADQVCWQRMTSIFESSHAIDAQIQFELAVLEAEASLRNSIARKLTMLLVAIAGHVLNRPYHRRRA